MSHAFGQHSFETKEEREARWRAEYEKLGKKNSHEQDSEFMATKANESFTAIDFVIHKTCK